MAETLREEPTPAIAVRTRAGGPRILVLLAASNGARWIREQMDSILAQQRVELRVAVRDDASTDGTRWELARFAEDARVKVATAATASGSAARNFLALIAENPAGPSDFVAFADQDDVWNKDKLYRACEQLASSGAAGYSSATLAVWEDGRERTIAPSGPPTASDFLFEGAGQGCTFVLTRELYDRVRQFLLRERELTAELHWHDWLIYALARCWNMRWCFDTQPSMRYRQHGGNDTGARGTITGITRRLTLIRQGWYRTQLRVIAEVCRAAAPTNPTVLAWHREFLQPRSWRRALQLVRICLAGGRRRTRDNLVVIFSALCGWI